MPVRSSPGQSPKVALPGAKGRADGQVVVINHVTLDGVMQDRAVRTRTLGVDSRTGWAPAATTSPIAKTGERMGRDRAFLFGRRTYEQLLASWNAQGGPFKDALNNTQKYVASHSPCDEARMAELDASGRRCPGRGRRAQAGIEQQPRDHGQRGIDRRADGCRPDR